MADKKNVNKKDNKKETVKAKKKVYPKIFIIIGAAIAALALTLFLIFDDGLPKNVKEGIEANYLHQANGEIVSLKKEKRFKVADSEYDKETSYLVSATLEMPYSAKSYVVILAVEIEEDGKELVKSTVFNKFDSKEKAEECIKELKKDPASWADEVERRNSYFK